MSRDFEERLEEIRWTLSAPGHVFYGSISDSGHVSQMVVDAGEDMKFLLNAVDTLIGYADNLETTLDMVLGEKK